MTKLGFYLLIIVALIACNSNKKEESDDARVEEIRTNARFISSEKLFVGLELPLYTEKIKASREKKLIMPTGAEIKIPADAFVDKTGKDIKGEVTIKYKEIKSPADIIIENIDMTYDSLGKNYQFVTAGMFDLRAYSGDEEVKLKTGKSIEVSYISNKKGNYGFYYNESGWKYAGSPKENIPLNANAENSPNSGILLPVAANASEDLIIDIKTSHKNFPELAVYKNVLWKYSGELSTKEVSGILDKPVANSALLASNKTGEYIYKFKTSVGNYEFPVKPVFSPKAMKEALKAYNEMIAGKENNQKIKRIVDVTRLGLMNYDAIYHRSDAMLVSIDVKIKNNEQTQVKGLPLFHITGEDDVLVNISDKREIYYSKELNNKIVAILPGHKVAVMGTKDFVKAMQSSSKGKTVILELDEMETQIKSVGDLNNIISAL